MTDLADTHAAGADIGGEPRLTGRGEPALTGGLVGQIGVAVLLAAGIWAATFHNYLLFHSVAEAACAAVAAAMFAVAWNTRRFSSNGYLTFLGLAGIFIAGVDVLHTLAFKGMGVFPGEGADLPTQLWIAGRSIQAAALALAPVFLTRPLRPWPTLLGWLAVTSALLALIFPLDLFPTCYVESGPNQGLTGFKIAAEYFIALVLLGALGGLWRQRRRLSPRTLELMTAAIVVTILSELAFTQYVSVYGDFNSLGHVLKVVAFVLTFKAVVEGSLRDPYHELFRDLQQHALSVRTSEQRYRSLVEMAPDPLLVERGQRIELVNPAAVHLFGAKTPEDLVGRSPFELFHPHYHPRLRHRIVRLMHGRSVPLTEGRVLRLDGTVRDVEVVAAPFDDQQGRAVQVVLRDITERKRAQEALRENAERLAEANRTKDEFLATLSHELRTPLNAILGWSELLLKGQLDEAKTRRAIEVIDRNAKAQTALISDVLDVSRIISGKLRLSLRSIDIVDCLQAALDTVRPAADARRLQVVTPVLEHVTVRGDPDRLQQVFWNLLSNAVKFTPEEGRVTVSVQRHAANVQVEVRDTGPGLTPEALSHLFERFWQADRSTARRHGGLGLGLAIVRHLVELHGGQVRAESEGPGCGATFAVTIPVEALEETRADEEGETIARTAHATTVAGRPSLRGLKVLLVDDDEDARDVLSVALRGYGAECQAAATAREGLRVVAEWRPHIVVSDIGMPGEDGYAFVEQLRELPPEQGGQTPAVALTAYGRAEDRIQALAAGYREHLVKPVPPDILASTLAALARRGPAAGGHRQGPG